MTVIEFINHLKHKNIKLIISCGGLIIYDGYVGSYLHWVNKNKWDNYIIQMIEPFQSDSLEITLSGEVKL